MRPRRLLRLAVLHHAGSVHRELLCPPGGLRHFPGLAGAVAQRFLARSAHAGFAALSARAPSLRCAKLGVAKAETASPSASAAATCLFLSPISSPPSVFCTFAPSCRGNDAREQSSGARLCIAASLPAARGRNHCNTVMPRDES